MSRLRLQKISALSTVSPAAVSRSMIARRAARLSLIEQRTKCWATVSAGDAGGATDTSLGFIRNFSASRRISGAIVAEKDSVCRRVGGSDTVRSTLGMNPLTSIREESLIKMGKQRVSG